ncbi:MAG: GntR family transcriptional regulator [Chloroflexi bacterium]|nr:GntR family transcriptional regulator [Chloroflexota bacterium]
MEVPSLPRLDPHPNVSQVVYEALKNAIIEQRLPSGSRLVESTIAGSFGVSTTPVREALTRLEREGLVSLLPRRGAVVTSFNAEDVIELGELREILESYATRRAVERLAPELVADLRRLLAAGERVVASGDQRAYGPIDQEFHRLLVQAAGNRRLARTFAMMNDQFHMVRYQAVRLPGRPAAGHREHVAILAALEAGRGEEAVSLLCAHIHHTVDDLCAALPVAGETQTAAD